MLITRQQLEQEMLFRTGFKSIEDYKERVKILNNKADIERRERMKNLFSLWINTINAIKTIDA